VLRETPTGATARSAAFQTRRLGQEAWWTAFQPQRAKVFYPAVEMKLTELGIRVCGEPVVSEEMALTRSATGWGFK